MAGVTGGSRSIIFSMKCLDSAHGGEAGSGAQRLRLALGHKPDQPSQDRNPDRHQQREGQWKAACYLTWG
jgi:hypothetical protein